MTPDAVHLSQIDPDLRAALEDTLKAFQQEDEDLERATLRALRETRIQSRVPALCAAARTAQPNLSIRQMLRAVALITGFSRAWVEKLYYDSLRGRHVPNQR